MYALLLLLVFFSLSFWRGEVIIIQNKRKTEKECVRCVRKPKRERDQYRKMYHFSLSVLIWLSDIQLQRAPNWQIPHAYDNATPEMEEDNEDEENT